MQRGNAMQRSTQKTLTAAVAAILFVTLNPAQAQAQDDGPWLVRARAVHLSPADKSDPIGGVGASNRLSVSDKTIPEVDLSYFFTPSVSAELVLTYPQKHDVALDGNKIGPSNTCRRRCWRSTTSCRRRSSIPMSAPALTIPPCPRSNCSTARAAWITTAGAWPCRPAWTTRSTSAGRSTSTSRRYRSAAT